jgi:MFS family permease
MKKKVTKKEKIVELKHQARRRSIKEGIFANIQYYLGYNYITPFAIAINASNSLIALMGSVGGLLGPISQLFSSRLMEKHSRKSIVLKAVLFEALMWIPYLIIGFLFYKGIAPNLLPLLLIIAFSIMIAVGNIGGPAWFSWMGDIVDEEYRGRWYAKRNLLLGVIAIGLALISSLFLDYFKSKNWVMFGFILLFLLAMFGRLISWQCFKKQYEPKIKLKKGYYFSFWSFLVESPKTNFGRFTLYRCFLSFSVAIAGPLIAVYLLRNLEFSYKIYMIITMTGTFFSLFFLELWGKIADRFGNYNVMIISSFFIPMLPVLWIIGKSPIYLILVPSIISSISWAGLNLASGNFIYDNVSQEKRGLALAYYNMTLGIGIFLGAGLGAILIKYVNINLVQPIILVFIISSILRALTVIIGLSKIKEIRKTEKLKGNMSIKDIILKEAKPTLVEEFHQLMSLKKYIRD